METALSNTLPIHEGQRNDAIFRFAYQLRRLKPDAAIAELRPLVEEWHRQALPAIETKDFETTWNDFVRAWSRLHEPKSRLSSILADATIPNEVAGRRDLPTRRLMAACQALQRYAGTRPFFLGTRKAAEIIGTSHTYAGKLMGILRKAGILELVREAGSPSSGEAREWLLTTPTTEPRS